MIVTVHGKPVAIAPETITATRQWFYDNAMACITEAESGAVCVNDLASYREWRLQQAADDLAGKSDHTFAFAQRAVFIQTGECVPLLNY